MLCSFSLAPEPTKACSLPHCLPHAQLVAEFGVVPALVLTALVVVPTPR